MALQLTVRSSFDAAPHMYRVVGPADVEAFLRELAAEYVHLRSEPAVKLKDVTVEGIDVVSVDALEKRLKKAVIPPLTGSVLDVIRSDFGETIAFQALEADFATRFGYKGVRDRETVKHPGRGIDAVGIEEDDEFTLLLGEVKVSDEQRTPPRVVDKKKDSLRNQHRDHLKNRKATADKIWNLSRFARDSEVRDLLFKALLLLEHQQPIKIVCCCFLVRSEQRSKEADFGSFRASPKDYAPAAIRFYIVCTPDSVDETIERWYRYVKEEAGLQ